MTPYIESKTLRKPVVDEQWLSLNRMIHQVAPLCRNPAHLENAARVLQAEGGLEALARLITTEQTAFLVLAMLEKCGAFQRTAVINGGQDLGRGVGRRTQEGGCRAHASTDDEDSLLDFDFA